MYSLKHRELCNAHHTMGCESLCTHFLVANLTIRQTHTPSPNYQQHSLAQTLPESSSLLTQQTVRL